MLSPSGFGSGAPLAVFVTWAREGWHLSHPRQLVAHKLLALALPALLKELSGCILQAQQESQSRFAPAEALLASESNLCLLKWRRLNGW